MNAVVALWYKRHCFASSSVTMILGGSVAAAPCIRLAMVNVNNTALHSHSILFFYKHVRVLREKY